MVFLEQSGLGLPDESYYREERFADIRAKYREFVAAMFPLAGFDDAAERTDHVIALETALAAEHWDNVTTRDSQKTYNKMPWSEIAELAHGTDLQHWWTPSVARPAPSRRSSCGSPRSSRGWWRSCTASRSRRGRTGCAGRSSAAPRPT